MNAQVFTSMSAYITPYTIYTYINGSNRVQMPAHVPLISRKAQCTACLPNNIKLRDDCVSEDTTAQRVYTAPTMLFTSLIERSDEGNDLVISDICNTRAVHDSARKGCILVPIEDVVSLLSSLSSSSLSSSSLEAFFLSRYLYMYYMNGWEEWSNVHEHTHTHACLPARCSINIYIYPRVLDRLDLQV